MLTSKPRVLVPASVKAGEPFEVKALIAHPMETGLRVDEKGATIPRKLINRFSCRLGGELVFGADLFEAVAANPYFEFHVVATANGELEFVWEEDGGATARLTHPLVVTS